MFDRIVGQENAKKVLASMIVSDTIPHALLFVGPYGVGKGEMAFELARMLLCEHGPESGCTTCNVCYRASKLEHPDLHVLFPTRRRPDTAEKQGVWIDELSQHRKFLGEERYAPVVYKKGQQIVTGMVEEVRVRLMESSFEGGRRICVILSADKLNDKTANSLLKILEEPPGGVHLILTSERLSAVLPTIVSRSSVVRFRRLRDEEIVSFLEASGELESEKIVSYARTAGGSIKTAKALAFDNKAEMLSRSFDLYRSIALGESEKVVSEAVSYLWSRDFLEVEELINGFAMCTKSVLEKKLGIAHEKNEYSDAITTLSNATDIVSLNNLSAQFEEGLEMLGRNVNISTVMTSLFFELHDTYGKKQYELYR